MITPSNSLPAGRLFMHLGLGIAMLFASALAGYAQSNNLFPNGDFETANSKGDWPAKIGHPSKGDYSWKEENGDHYISMTSTEPGQTVLIYQQIGLKGAKEIKITVRARVTGLVKGPKSWFDARIMMDFRNANSKKMKDIKPIAFSADTNGWVERSVTAKVPNGAVFIAIMPSLLQPNAGTLDVSSITITPVTPSEAQ